MIPTKPTVTDTTGLMALAMDAKRREANRGRTYDLEALQQALHPAGSHVLSMQFVHNDVEWRTRWICRVAVDAQGEPMIAAPLTLGKNHDGEPLYAMEVWLDVSFEAFEAYTTSVESIDTVDESLDTLEDSVDAPKIEDLGLPAGLKVSDVKQTVPGECKVIRPDDAE